MFNHLGIVVTDFSRSLTLYERCLAPLGIHRTETGDGWAIFLRGSNVPFLWIGSMRPSFWAPGNNAGLSPIHVALVARDRKAVDAFHAAALAMGAIDNGAPGPRKGWADFYSAFVLDFDGNNIEATVTEWPGQQDRVSSA